MLVRPTEKVKFKLINKTGLVLDWRRYRQIFKIIYIYIYIYFFCYEWCHISVSRMNVQRRAMVG